MISKVAIELYDAKPISWMQTEERVIGSVWLTVELASFFANVFMNITFMFLRSLKEQEVKVELIDKKKQLPSVDTIEALGVIMSQYISFGAPMIVIYYLAAGRYSGDLDYGHTMCVRVGYGLLARFLIINF